MPVKLILFILSLATLRKAEKSLFDTDSVVNDLHHGIRGAGGVCIKEPTRLSSDGDNSRPDLQVVIGGEQVLVDVTMEIQLVKLTKINVLKNN